MANKKSTKSNGYILHQDSKRVVIATGFTRKSANAKTGNMLQVWILAKASDPIEAIATGADEHVCGKCPLRGINGQDRTCYVNLGQAPLAVYRAWKRGSYSQLPNYSLFSGRAVRLGAYGDPAYIPLSVVRSIVAHAKRHTGYTHQWRNPLFAGLREFVMASVEDIDSMREAHLAGWRTFRVADTIQAGDFATTTAHEIVCPNTTRGVSCADCGLCNGASIAMSILIEAHGSGKAHLQGVR